jgi:hypothetical protein
MLMIRHQNSKNVERNVYFEDKVKVIEARRQAGSD